MKIRERKEKGRAATWLVDFGVVDGKRLRRSFPTEKEAKKALAAASRERERSGKLGLALSPEELAEFLHLRDRLAREGASLASAVEFYLQHGDRVSAPLLVPDLVERFIESRIEAGRSLRTIQTYKCSLRNLARWFPLRHAHSITQGDLERWLSSQRWAPKTFNGALGDLRALFAWSSAQGHSIGDPAERIVRRREPREEIGTLTVEECERLLRVALRSSRRVLPYLVLALFGGVRRAELERLRWSAMDWEEGAVIVGAGQAKTRARRVVDLPANALAWLGVGGFTASTVDGNRKLTPSNLKFLLPEVRALAGLRDWPANALRHTFASMHYAQHRDEAKLQALMGHESASMLHRHYRALKSREEAGRFWGLLPPDELTHLEA